MSWQVYIVASDRLFVARIVVAVEDQWVAPDTEGPPVRAVLRYVIHQILFAAIDEEDAYRIVSRWLENEAFTNTDHDGPGDLTKMWAYGIHQLEEIARLTDLPHKVRDTYGIGLPAYHIGDFDHRGMPTVREKHDLEVFRVLRLLGPRSKPAGS
jgi:hypothetical protein